MNILVTGGTALRYFNPTGPFKVNPSHLLGRLMAVAMGQTAEFQLFGDDWPTPDGYAIRDFIHVWDLAPAFWNLSRLSNVFLAAKFP